MVDIENDVAVVGREVLAQYRLATHFDDLPGNITSCHRDDLQRQGEGTQGLDHFTVINDTDELIRNGCHNLFTGQRSATTLDQVLIARALIGTVHIDGKIIDAVQIRHRDTMSLEPIFGFFRTGHGTLDATLDFGQFFDEVIGCAASADTHIGTFDDIIDCRFGHGFFLCFLIHAYSPFDDGIIVRQTQSDKQNMLEDYVKEILKARVYDVAKETPLDFAPTVTRRTHNKVWLKREDLQPVFSYKLRGAHNLISSLGEAEKQRGVIAASAGNHAQGVALSASKLGIRSVIVMPKTTPEIKVNAVRHLGGEIVLHGNNYDEASEHAHQLAEEKGMTYIPPFDHPLVIAGQGTVGKEILQQHPTTPDIIFVPVGGGGLIAGVAAYVKYLCPEIKIVGVESDEAPSMKRSLEAGKPVLLDKIGIFADGAAVRLVGEETFRVARDHVDEVLLVNNDEICAAVKDIFEDTRSIPEPAGALALAGLKQYVNREGLQDKELVAIFSGANINFDRLRHVAELAELGEHREVLLGVTIPERPGSFREFCHTIGLRSITEFNYRYADSCDAHIFAGIQIKEGEEEKQALIATLKEKGYPVVDMSDNDMAKMHIRYMVGGHGANVDNEILVRFEFPERPGALLHFLTRIGKQWNISLFHYRNHGAAYGRVLMGIQVPESERPAFRELLQKLDLPNWEETDNPAYALFLR